jgi:hypothetical protein
MASPCPHCGDTKTESIKHGFIHDTLWNRGYHLRRCSFCNRWRLFKRADPNQRHPDDMTMEELQEHFDQKIAEASGKSPAASDTLEGNMSPDSLQQSGEHQAEASSSSIGLAEATDEVDEYRLCPKCGSTIFRRSHRRWYERLLRRPRMARCMKCDRRFPYPH